MRQNSWKSPFFFYTSVCHLITMYTKANIKSGNSCYFCLVLKFESSITPIVSFTAISDISKGQPLPPGMEDIITGPCQIWKTLENYDHPLIGLEFLLELNMLELKEPRYLCLLCDKRGDPRSILVHLTSQSHYLIYLVRMKVYVSRSNICNNVCMTPRRRASRFIWEYVTSQSRDI